MFSIWHAVVDMDDLNSLVDWLPIPVLRLALQMFRRDRYQRLNAFRRPDANGEYPLRPFDDCHSIFVHIPKCAGVSIATSLFGRVVCSHTTVRSLRLVYGGREFHDYFKFVFVRNPWDRLLSAYNFLKEGGMNDGDAAWARANIARYDSFGQFVDEWVTDENIYTWRHFIPQHRFVCIRGGRLSVDFVGYFENLDADYQYVREKIGTGASLERLNTSPAAGCDYRDSYDESARERVARVYRRDVDMFGYSFDNSSLQSQLHRRAARLQCAR